jgi:hypothetical protein
MATLCDRSLMRKNTRITKNYADEKQNVIICYIMKLYEALPSCNVAVPCIKRTCTAQNWQL